MAKCKCCGRTIWCGVLLHSECYEQLRQIWRPEDENPETTVEFLETDEGKVPYNVSDYVDTTTGVQYFSKSGSGTCVMVDLDGNPVPFPGFDAKEDQYG